jgi:hypothetical protein
VQALARLVAGVKANRTYGRRYERSQNEDAQRCAERLQQRQEAAAAALEYAHALPLGHGVGQQGTGLFGAEVVERLEHGPEAGQLPGNLRGVHGLGAVGNRPPGKAAGPLEGIEIWPEITQANGYIDA